MSKAKVNGIEVEGKTSIEADAKTAKSGRKATWAVFATVAAALVLAITLAGFRGTSSTTTVTSNAVDTTLNLPPEGGSTPLQLGLHAQNVTCTLATGTCTLVIIDNSTIPARLANCAVTSIPVVSTTSNSTTTTYSIVNGTAGSENFSISPYSRQTATCAVSPALLENAWVGGPADGTFYVQYAEAYYNIPAGTEIMVFFSGVWS